MTDETEPSENKEPSEGQQEAREDPAQLLRKELKECQEKYMRMLAESENVRKRMQKERQEMTKYAVENMLAEFLHPIDSLEKALQFAESMSDEVRNWAIGFEMLLNQFKQILSTMECKSTTV